ncbi:phosphatases II, partial [Dissoconium aciculare CBS 342.82]|uniref:Phosphatases II n=1 Tax=Dissoconium aciculare CBS 342.82 TaxID=1314786 RepID=A0A6J3M9N5_9PEZI
LSYPHRSDHYTYRVPTPPRIVVPPPALNADARPDINLSTQRNSPYTFLHNFNYANLVQSNAPLEWKYEFRREAQSILPYLALGPMLAAKNEAQLVSNGTTMLVGIAQKQPTAKRLMTSALQVVERMGLEHHLIDVADNQDLIHNFPEITHLINTHLLRTWDQGRGRLGQVLVFCESGNERSACVIAAYLMETHDDVDHIKAMQLCQAQRFCVNFDDSSKRLLQGYWDILCAKRAVANVMPSQTPFGGNASVQSRPKRTLERDDDGDDLMEQDDDDQQRFAGRSFAPFVD